MHNSQGIGAPKNNRQSDQFMYNQGQGYHQHSPGNFSFGGVNPGGPTPSPQNKQYATISQPPPPMDSPNLAMRSPHSPRQSPQANSSEYLRYQYSARDSSSQYNGNSSEPQQMMAPHDNYGQVTNPNQQQKNYQYEQPPQRYQPQYQQNVSGSGREQPNIPRNMYGNGSNGQSGPIPGQFQTQMAPSSSQTFSPNVAPEVSLTDQGTRLKLMGNLDGAMAQYIEASKINHNYAPAYYNIGVMYVSVSFS